MELPDGYLLQLDAGTLPVRLLRTLPTRLLDELRDAAVPGAVVSAPARSRWDEAFAHSPSHLVHVQIVRAVRKLGERDLGRAHALVIEELVTQGLEWLSTGDLGESLFTVTSLGDEVVSQVPRELAHRVLTALLGSKADAMVFDARHDPAAARAVHLLTLLAVQLDALEALPDPIPEATADALKGIVADWRPAALDAVWAGVEVQLPTEAWQTHHVYGLRLGGSSSEHTTQEVIGVNDWVVPDAYWWQVLSAGHLHNLGSSVPAEAQPLAGDRVEVVFGEPADWVPAFGRRAETKARARAALAPLLQPRSLEEDRDFGSRRPTPVGDPHR